jgi:hypothetical protein
MMSYRDFKGGMRPGQNKRSRNRNNGGGGGGGHQQQNNNGNRPRMPNRMQTFDSSGPNIKIRGNAYQVFERYIALAREASSAGDRIAAENFYQHAEHYFRIMNADGQGNPMQQQRPMTPADTEMSAMDGDGYGDNNGNNNNNNNNNGGNNMPPHGEAEQVSTQPPQQPPHNHDNDPESSQGQ